MTAGGIARAGAFSTRRFVLSAGAEAQFDCDAVQLLVTELDNADQMELQLNQGDVGRAWKGFEATGRILHARAINTGADQITVEFLLVSPGLQVRDRRLNQVGDLGLVQTFANFLPLGAVTIPAQSVRLVAAADVDRRYLLLTNKAGQLRELYISGAAIDVPQITLTNPDFELGNTAWNGLDGTAGNFAAVTGGGTITGPQSGTLFARHGPPGDSGTDNMNQDSPDMVATLGFDAALIDTGALPFEASVWAAREDAGNMQLELTWRSSVAGPVLQTDTNLQAITAWASGGWQEIVVSGLIPVGARSVRVELEEPGFSSERAFDNFTIQVDGVPPSTDELAGMIMPAADKLLPSNGAVYAFNPHTSEQKMLVGEIKG